MSDPQVLKYLIADLEYCLSVHLRPGFLLIIVPEDSENEIAIVVSCPQFKNKSIQKRIAIVFQLISKYVPAIIQEALIVVQAYDSAEIEQYLDGLFTEELR